MGKGTLGVSFCLSWRKQLKHNHTEAPWKVVAATISFPFCLSYSAPCKCTTCSPADYSDGNSLRRRKLPGRMEGGVLTKAGIKERKWASRGLAKGKAGAVRRSVAHRIAPLTVGPTMFYNWKHLSLFKRIFKQQNQVSTFLVTKEKFYSNKLGDYF